MTAPTTPLSPVVLEFGTCRLRSFEDRDGPLIVEAGLDPLIPLITTIAASGNADQASAFIERQRARLTTGYGYSLVIEEKASGQAVGQIGLWLRDKEQGRASVGYWLLDRARGRGLAGQALRSVCAFAFTRPELHRVELHVEPWNEASWRTAERVGFHREGLLRSWQQIGTERRDLYVYSLLRGECDSS